MNREELVRVVLWQFAAIVVTALGSWIGFGSGAGLSAMFGGLCVAVPNAMFALYLLRSLGSKKPVAPALILLGELLKIFVICADGEVLHRSRLARNAGRHHCRCVRPDDFYLY